MANLNVTMKKLQRAILQTGLVIKISTSQFYSEEQNRMVTMYSLSTPTEQRDKKGGWKTRDYEILRTAAVAEVVKCMIDIYKAVK